MRLIGQHGDQLAGAGIRNDRRRSEQRTDDQDIRPVQQNLRRLTDSDPQRSRQVALRRIAAERQSARHRGGKSASQSHTARHHRKQLRDAPAGGEGWQSEPGHHQADGQRCSRGPGTQLRAGDECQILQANERRLKGSQRKRRDEDGEHHAKRYPQQLPRTWQPPQRNDCRRQDDGHLGERQRHRPFNKVAQLGSITAACPSRHVRRFAWQECDDAEVHQQQVGDDLRADEPQAIRGCAEPCEQKGREPQAYRSGERHVHVADRESAEKALGASHRSEGSRRAIRGVGVGGLQGRGDNVTRHIVPGTSPKSDALWTERVPAILRRPPTSPAVVPEAIRLLRAMATATVRGRGRTARPRPPYS